MSRWKPSLDLFVRDLVEPRSLEVEVLVEEAAVALGGTGAVLLLAFGDVEIAGGVPGDRARSALAQSPLRKEALGLHPRIRQGDDRVAADRGEPAIGAVLHDEGLAAAL